MGRRLWTPLRMDTMHEPQAWEPAQLPCREKRAEVRGKKGAIFLSTPCLSSAIVQHLNQSRKPRTPRRQG